MADNAEELTKTDENIMKIRIDAVELLQQHQTRNDVEEEVEALSSCITSLQEQRVAVMERMKSSQAEEVKLYQDMKAAVRKVSSKAVFSFMISLGGTDHMCVGHSKMIINLNSTFHSFACS